MGASKYPKAFVLSVICLILFTAILSSPLNHQNNIIDARAKNCFEPLVSDNPSSPQYLYYDSDDYEYYGSSSYNYYSF